MVQKPSSRQNPIFSSAFRTGCAFYRSPTGGRKRPAVSGWRGALSRRAAASVPPGWTGGARDVARGDATGQTRASRSSLFSAERKQSRRWSCDRPPPPPPPRPAVLFLTTSQPSAGTCSARRRTPVPAPGSGGDSGPRLRAPRGGRLLSPQSRDSVAGKALRRVPPHRAVPASPAATHSRGAGRGSSPAARAWPAR